MAKHKLGTVLREWQEVEPDVRPQPLSELGLDCGSLLKVLGNWMGGIRFYITPACLEAVCLHVGSSTLEVGGLLLGRAFEVDSEGDPVVLIERSLESLEFRNSSVRVEMEPEVWNRAHAAYADGLYVVGWYHSHPNLGAFFSATDRNTQRAFFDRPYSIGWVIDPHRVEQKVFVGREAIESTVPLIVLDSPAAGTLPGEKDKPAAGVPAEIEVVMIPTLWSEPVGVSVIGPSPYGDNGR